MFGRFWLPGPVQLGLVLLIALGLLGLLRAMEPESARDAPQAEPRHRDSFRKVEKKAKRFWSWVLQNSPLKGGDE
jgi:hypothetical protein